MRTLLIGSTGGIGAALASALEARSEEVVGLGRSSHGLDITDEASVAQHLGALEGDFDRILVTTGGLEIAGHGPEKTIRGLDPEAMQAQFRLNAIGPALVMKHALPLLPKDRRAVLAALSARVGSIGDNRLGGWVSYRASKAALHQIIRTTAIEMGRLRPKTITIALHPGTVETDLTRKYLARHPAVPPTEAAQNLLRVMDGVGEADSGHAFDWAGAKLPW